MTDRDLRSALQAELEFLNTGHQGREGWRPYAVFEESSLCVNPLHMNRPAACQTCPLLTFVPEDKRHEAIPCRHIALNDRGLTPQNLPQWGNRKQMETALRKWLESTLKDVESRLEPLAANSIRS